MDLFGAAFNTTQLLTGLVQAAVAFVLGATIGWERHRAHRTAGLRTFPIVAMASCAYVLVGQSAFLDNPEAQSRIIQGLITGIGFIGGGAILKDNGGKGVFGIATAASIWNTVAIGRGGVPALRRGRGADAGELPHPAPDAGGVDRSGGRRVRRLRRRTA